MDPNIGAMEGGLSSKTLFKEAMLGNWKTVVEMYTNSPWAREAKITRAEDTVLHVAVSEADTDVIRQLIDSVVGTAKDRILAMKNESGNTALHVAAALGLEEVCRMLAERSPSLAAEARNDNGETPLFVAAQHGKKKAFFVLQYVIERAYGGEVDAVSYCRRRDGNNILHTAIYGEFFDLAFEIIHLHPKLINFNNERGQSPLHLLANKPSVFKSGSRIRRTDSLVYACTIVDPLKVKYQSVKDKIVSNGQQAQESKIKLPENYQTCSEIFSLLTHLFNLVVACFHSRSSKKLFIVQDIPTESLQVVINKGREEGIAVAKQGEPETQRLKSKYSRIPENYVTCFRFFKITMKILLVVLGIGIRRIEKIKRKKQKHTYARQIMDELVSQASFWEYDMDGRRPYKFTGKNGFLRTQSATEDGRLNPIQPPSIDGSKEQDQMTEAPIQLPFVLDASREKLTFVLDASKEREEGGGEPEGDTPVLVAAKRGVTEMVKKILDTFPVALQDLDSDHKNIVLLAVEHRQPHVYRLMLERKKMKESVFGRVDKEGNSALHLAATIGEGRPWIIPGAALQMQWEIKWYKFVKNSMESSFFPHYNNKGQTAREIFTQKHEQLVKDGGKWLTNTSQSCSVVAALIATVAFASATTVPGGVQTDGLPTLEGQPAFDVFAISALIALCFSVTSLIMFLSILTSRYQEMDFENDLPMKLILGLTSLFMSIAAMLVSFCAGHFYVIEKKLKYAAYPIYAVTCLPVTFFAVAQFPLYVDLIKATITHVPERTYKTHTF